MKVSKEQKQKTRKIIVETAVELITEHGFQQTSMKKIAKGAGIGDATIYKYFSSKEKILLAYYEIKAQESIDEVKNIESFSEFTLQEKLQTLINTYLDTMLPDREFVIQSLKLILYTPLFLFKDIVPVKREFNLVIHEFLETARKDKEISSFPFDGLLTDFICEYIVGIVLYWISDDSEEFSNTTQMIDLTLNLGSAILSSGIIEKGMEIISFIIKSHLLRFMSGNKNILSQLKNLQKIYR